MNCKIARITVKGRRSPLEKQLYRSPEGWLDYAYFEGGIVLKLIGYRGFWPVYEVR